MFYDVTADNTDIGTMEHSELNLQSSFLRFSFKCYIIFISFFLCHSVHNIPMVFISYGFSHDDTVPQYNMHVLIFSLSNFRF